MLPRILVGQSGRKKPHERSRDGWEVNMNMDIKQIMNGLNLAGSGCHLAGQALVKMVLLLQVP
jgi:hypothetical protein